jgi:DNA repair photolyase
MDAADPYLPQVQHMRIHHYRLKTGITRTPEFEKKGLATHAVNIGTKCGHGCLYCSSGAVLRMHESFRQCGEDPVGFGYAIIDPSTPERVAKDAERIQKTGLVQLCTFTDAWAPGAQEHQLGRRCLQAILSQSGWTVRILTKNMSVRDDFDLIEKHRDRVSVGLSITAPLEKSDIIQVLEPNASSIQDRMLAMVEAAARGLRTYAMFCPLLPGIADSQEDIQRLVKFAVDCRAEEIFVEPVNPRGPGLRLCQEALEQKGFTKEAEAIAAIRQRARWSSYVAELVSRVQEAVRKHSDISKLRFLLYPSALLAEDKARIQRDDAGVIWLG